MNANEQVQRGLPLSSFIKIDIRRKISPMPLSEQYAIKEALQGVASGSSLLDIGSGYGRLFPFYHSLGFIITGCEPNKEYATYLRGSYPNTLVLPVTVQNLSEGNIYDIACVSYTLLNMFHFTDQELILRKLCKIAKRVVIDVYVAHPSKDKRVIIEDLSDYGVDYQLTAYLRTKAWYEHMGKEMGKKVSFVWYTFTKNWWVPVQHTLVTYQ